MCQTISWRGAVASPDVTAPGQEIVRHITHHKTTIYIVNTSIHWLYYWNTNIPFLLLGVSQSTEQ